MSNRTRFLSLLTYFYIVIFSLQLYSQTDKYFTTPVDKFAHVIVSYSLDLQPNETLLIETTTLPKELCLSVYREAIRAGAHPYIACEIPGANEIFLQTANDSQLTYVSPVYRFMYEHFDARLYIHSPANTKSLSSIDSKRIRIANKAFMDKAKRMYYDRIESQQMKWCYTSYPTQALAQEADMGLEEYRAFVLESCKLNESNPIESWKRESEQQQKWIEWLNGKDQIVLRGPNIDMRMSIKGRTFLKDFGKENFPGGEIATSPVENTVNGWVSFSYPAIYKGREVIDVELWFENGIVVKEKATKGQEFLTELLNSDTGARILGELGIGTNYGIKRFTKNMLFDEKMGGTIHLALGLGFPECGGKNKSAIHWDMLCDMSVGEILVDGEVFYKNGKFVKY